MYVVAIPNRSSPPAILLRESYREGGKVKNRTLSNLSGWSPERIEAMRQVCKGNLPLSGAGEDSFEIIRSRPHGHVAAALGTLRRLGLESMIAAKRSRRRDLCVAMIVARILDPRSKLSTARGLDAETLESSLGEVLGLSSAHADELYEAMDWIVARQAKIEGALAKRHLSEGSLVLYDLTSAHFEGRHCSLARLGYPRDGRRGKLQIELGLLTDAEGRPVAVEVFEGNVADPKTLGAQVDKVRSRFGIRRVVFVGDRGMITEARIREELEGKEGLGWITALRSPQIQALLERGSLQLSLFDERDLAEIRDPQHPGERLVVCRNPLLAQERARKREDLLAATERELAKVARATQRTRSPLHDPQAISRRVGKVEGRFKMRKHFQIEIAQGRLRYERDREGIAQEAALDGIYVLRTSVAADTLGAEEVVRSYKKLSSVERAFRSLKTVDLKVRPIFHRKEDRVRAHVLLCMLAYYVEWHLRGALAPLLFDDDDRRAAEARRASVVAPARRSLRAERKALTKKTDGGLAVHSFQSLLRDLATITKNRIRPKHAGAIPFEMTTRPTMLQQRAFELLAVPYRL